MAEEPQGAPTLSPAADAPSSANGAASPPAAGSQPDWRSTLSEEMRGERGWERFQTVDNLARSYRELERRLGDRAPSRPGPEATDTERSAWRQYLGVPDTPQGYQVTRPGALGEGQEFDPQRQEAFLSLAHQLDLQPHQVQQLLDWEAQQVQTYQTQAQQQEREEQQRGEQAGQQKWGAQWPIKLALAQEYLRRMGSEELRSDLETLVVRDGTGKPILAGNHPGIIELLAEHAELTGHAPYVIGEGGSVLSQSGAKERLEAAYQDHRQGNITSEQLASAVERFAPLAFG